jgi:hypothetical protein
MVSCGDAGISFTEKNANSAAARVFEKIADKMSTLISG